MASKKKDNTKRFILTDAEEALYVFDTAILAKDRKDFISQVEENGELPEQGDTWTYNVYELVGQVKLKASALDVEDNDGILAEAGSW